MTDIPPPAQSPLPLRRSYGPGPGPDPESEPGLTRHYLIENWIRNMYGVKKVSGEFYVYTLADISPLRSHLCIGKAIMSADGHLTGIDRTASLPPTGPVTTRQMLYLAESLTM
jgi:hypothetical protein